jgi:hypothetical protein
MRCTALVALSLRYVIAVGMMCFCGRFALQRLQFARESESEAYTLPMFFFFMRFSPLRNILFEIAPGVHNVSWAPTNLYQATHKIFVYTQSIALSRNLKKKNAIPRVIDHHYFYY